MKSSRISLLLIVLAAFSVLAGGCDILVTERGGESEPCDDNECDQGLVCVNDVCVDDSACNDLCEPAGESRCRPGGLVVEKCAPVGKCLDWVQDIDCGANDEVCNPDPNPHCEGCNSNCPKTGDRRCRFGDDAVEECTDMGNGCLIWTDLESCSDIGQICVETPNPHCEDGCQSNCPNDGLIRCHPTDPTVEVCASDGDCLNWQLQEDCGQNGNICLDDGTPHCEPGCNHLCSLNDTRCTPDQQGRDVCLADGDGCRVWQFQDNCASDEHCNDSTGSAICEINCPSGTHSCPALGEERCSPDNNVVETCKFDADWCRFWTLQDNCVDQGWVCVNPDGNNPRCDGDPCVDGDECPAVGDQRCVDGARFLQHCQEDPADTCLRWTDFEDCELLGEGFYCQNGSCADPCLDGHTCDTVADLQCNGNGAVEECQIDTGEFCRHWVEITNCIAMGGQCSDLSGTAQCECISHECEIGENRCSDDYNQFLYCDQNLLGCRVWGVQEDCAGGGDLCLEDSDGGPFCGPCPNDCTVHGQKRCRGDVLDICGPRGTCTLFQLNIDCAADSKVCEQVNNNAYCRFTPPSSCSNGVYDNDGTTTFETDTDCGGPDCLRCGGHRTCTANVDCLSDNCDPVNNHWCELPDHCNNAVFNPELGEEGFDCGGPCLGCLGAPCNTNDQCNYDVWCNPNEMQCNVWLDAWYLGFSTGAIKSIDLSGEQFGIYPQTHLLAYSDASSSNIGVQTFNANNIPFAQDLMGGHSGPVESLAFGPPGPDGYERNLFSTGGNTLAQWPYQKADSSYGAHSQITGNHERVAVEPEGRYIATSSGNNDIAIHNLQGNPLLNLTVNDPINDMAFSYYRGSNPSFLVVATEAQNGGGTAGVTMFHIDSNPNPVTTATHFAVYDTPCRKITIHASNQYVAATCGASGTEWIEVVDLQGNHVATSATSSYSTVAFQPDENWGHYLFAGTHDSRLVVFDLSKADFPGTFDEMCNRSFGDQTTAIYNLAHTPYNAWMALSSWNEIVIIDTAQWMTLLQQNNCWMPSP